MPLNRRRFIQAALALGGAGMLGLAGCSTRETQPTAGEAGGAGLTVTDQFGRTVSFDGPVDRIATTIIPLPAMLAGVDQSLAKVVAVNSSAQMLAEKGFLATMFPEIMDLPIAANGADFVPNIETIVAQHPDVTIQWGHYGDEIITPIEQAGLELLLLNYGTQEMLEEWVSLLSTLVGKPERGQQILETMHTDLARVESVVGKAGQRPRAVNIYNYDELQVSGPGSYMDYWLTLCGADNVITQKGSSVAIAKEELLKLDPEVIFLGNFSPATPETLYQDPFWADVSAVANRRVYRVPNGGFSWDPPSNESNLMWQWAATLINPEVADFHLRSAMKENFAYLYNHDLSEEQIDQILFLDANRGSADYDVFTG
ncbi:ABC transporter substrate-binding protein [Corynebacterium sp. A21]|uniref:ABC transporter substrate-binding protein n=1 Tax=Corynebacterium sp. A21 TaxID=3457318 RepID=UPI003FD156F2